MNRKDNDEALAETLAEAPAAPATETARAGLLRTTVLPRASGAATEPAEAGPRFATLRPLGAGGVGEVVLVQDHDIERKVAVKRLRPELRGDEALGRFADEVRIIGQLEHPNITPVHDVGLDENGQHYFVMKYVEGETLDAVIKRLKAGDPEAHKRFTHEARAEIFLAVLNAVAYAHARGIVHRDIKPSNIMVGPFGEVTVMDWGIAKRLKDGRRDAPLATGEAPTDDPRTRTTQGQLLGTPLYMSPEQARGDLDAIDERSDVFALGLLLWELMTLAHPLAHLPTVTGVVTALATQPLPSPRAAFHAVHAPVEYADALAPAVAFDRDARLPSVQAFAERLTSLRAGKILVKCSVTMSKRMAAELIRWADRHVVALHVAWLAVVGAFGYSGYALVRALVHALR